MTYKNPITGKMGGRARPGNYFALRAFWSFPAMLWVMLWVAINTGPWVLKKYPVNLMGWLHATRTVFPFLVLLSACFILSAIRNVKLTPLPSPVKMLAIYGVISGVASVMWPASLIRSDFFGPAYWSVAYMSGIAVIMIWVQGENIVNKIVQLNHLGWLVASLFLAIMLVSARGALFVGSGAEMTGYGVATRVGDVAGMPMSRASGVARFAAIPGILCFVYFWKRRGFERLVWLVPTILSAGIVYLMQSRGAILGFGLALCFVMLSGGKHTRRIGVVLIILMVFVVMMNLVPEEIMSHLTRKETVAKAGMLTGRDRAWKHAAVQIMKSPLWGWGIQADRLVIEEHVHNTYLYALLSGGFLGGIPFLYALFLAWKQFFGAITRNLAIPLRQDTFLIQAGGLLAFFTVRSMSEVCGSMFGVDYMIMLPIMAYLGVLDRHYKSVRSFG